MSPPYFDNRGFLLIETLVTLMVVSIVLGLGLRFLVPMLHIQTRTSERVEMQQRAERLMETIRRDLACTTPEALSYAEFESERILAVHRPSDVQADGRGVWSSELVLYRWDATTHTLSRSIWTDQEGAVLKTSGPNRLSPQQVQALFAVSAPSMIIPWVESLEVEWEDSTPGFPINLRTVLSSPRGEQRTFERTFTGRLPLV